MRWRKNNLKFGSKTTIIDGLRFASRLEADLYSHLKILSLAKQIGLVSPQPAVFLTDAKIKMIPDFRSFDYELGKYIYWEAKGFETEAYKIKKKLWKVYGPAPLRVFVRAGSHGLKLKEEIIPGEINVPMAKTSRAPRRSTRKNSPISNPT